MRIVWERALALVLGEQEMEAGQIVLQDMLSDAPREAISQAEAIGTVLRRLNLEASCNA